MFSRAGTRRSTASLLLAAVVAVLALFAPAAATSAAPRAGDRGPGFAGLDAGRIHRAPLAAPRRLRLSAAEPAARGGISPAILAIAWRSAALLMLVGAVALGLRALLGPGTVLLPDGRAPPAFAV